LQRKQFRPFQVPTHSPQRGLSVVCHIRAPCINRSMDLHAAQQVYLWGPVTHCVRYWGLWMQGRGDLGVGP